MTASRRAVAASMLGELIAHGRTSDVYRFGEDGAAKVLKATTPQEWAQAEASFTESVRRVGVSAPEVRDVMTIDGRATVVFERIDGPSMWQRMCERPDDVEALTRELVDVQASIHRAGVPDDLPSLVDRLRLKLGGAPELMADEYDEAIDLLDSLPCGAALLHGDLHPGNIVLADRGVVIIDWFDATVGHPTADIARTALLLQARGATDLRHLPGAPPEIAERVHRGYIEATGGASSLAEWIRLRAAGRLAERNDADVTGLLAMWRSGHPGPTM